MASILILLLLVPFVAYLLVRKYRTNLTLKGRIIEFSLIAIFAFSFFAFVCGWMMSSAEYYTAIDVVDDGYTPFASKHLLTLLVFLSFSIWAIIAIWLKGNRLPPLLFVLAFVFLIIGMTLSFVIILQLSENIGGNGAEILMLPFPICFILVSILLLLKIAYLEAEVSATRTYQNKFLNYLNTKMAQSNLQPVYVLVLLVPVFAFIVAILMVFGQDYNSIAKVLLKPQLGIFRKKPIRRL